VGAFLTALPVGLLLAPGAVLKALHVLARCSSSRCVALRFAAVASIRPARPAAQVPMPEGDVPVFTVLVALYREAGIVPGLLAALDRIVWPRQRLEIKLVCEADDADTLARCGRAACPPMSRWWKCRRASRGPSRRRSPTRCR